MFNEGLFALRVTGSGTMFFSGYGDIQEIQVDGQYTVDNGFAVAWEPQLQWTLTRARKIIQNVERGCFPGNFELFESK